MEPCKAVDPYFRKHQSRDIKLAVGDILSRVHAPVECSIWWLPKSVFMLALHDPVPELGQNIYSSK